MINLYVQSHFDTATGTCILSVYAGADNIVALGGFSLDVDFWLICPEIQKAIQPNSITPLGQWDLLDQDISTGKVSAISALGQAMVSPGPAAPLFKASFVGLPDEALGMTLNVKATGSDSFFDSEGQTLLYQNQWYWLDVNHLEGPLSRLDSPIVAAPLADQSLIEDVVFGWSIFREAFTYPEPLTYHADQPDGSSLPAWLVFDENLLSFQSTPGDSAVGSLSVRVTATNAQGSYASDIFVVTVTNINDQPTGSVSITGTATQGQVLTATNSLNDVDGMGAVSYQWLADGNVITDARSDTLSLTQAQVGKKISVKASYTDAQGTAETVSSGSTDAVANINDAPTATGASLSTDEDTAKSGTLVASDVDGNTLTFSKVDGPTHGTVTLNAATGAYTYTPTANYNGSDSFTFKVNDGTVDSAVATVSITINAVNDAPTVKALLADVQIAENRSLTLSLSDSIFNDIDDTTLTYSAKLASGAVLPNWVQFNADTRTFSFRPGLEVVGATAQAFSVEVTATDSAGLKVSDSFDVWVRPPGYDIQANVTFWKASTNGQRPNIAGVSLSKGVESGTTTAQTGVTLAGVDDTEGVDDGFMSLTPNASSPSNSKSAITLTDVLAALKVYLGKALPDSYTSPLNYIAADFDANGTVNLTDVLSLLKYYLGKSTSSVPKWAFVDAADFSTDGKSLIGASNQALSKTDTTPHTIDQSFVSGHESIQIIGVLRGDVDGSWSANL